VINELILLLICAFLPPAIYTIWIRNTEKHHRQRWKSIVVCFIWGATISIIAAIILEVILDISLAITFENGNPFGLTTAILVAPFAEELVKPRALRLRTVKSEITELEDGLIYGAVAGLGFSATENLIYGIDFLSEGLIYFLVLISIRSFGGCLLHASATAWTGYGYGKSLILGRSIFSIFPYFAIAVFMHAFYNFLVSYDFAGYGLLTGLFAALIFVGISIRMVRSKIKKLDHANL